MIKEKCRYLHSDWCHHPKLEFQELCDYYLDNDKCNWYKPKIKEFDKK